MRLTTALLIALCLVSVGTVWGESIVTATGTATLTPGPTEDNGVRKVTVAWISAASGGVTSSIKNVYGSIARVAMNPGAASPTASYDMTLGDEDAFDILDGGGANLSATTNSNVWISNATNGYQGFDVAGHLLLTISNAGNAKAGEIRIYMKVR